MRLNCPSWRQRVASWALEPPRVRSPWHRPCARRRYDATLLCHVSSCFLRNKKRPVVSLPEASTWHPAQISPGRTCFPSCMCWHLSAKCWNILLGSGALNILKGLESRVCSLKAVLLNTLCARENAASTKFPLTETERLSTST